MTRSIRRVLMCSMAVPWPNKPNLCAFHHDQAHALRALGTDMRLFSPAPKVPRMLRFLHRRFRRHIERPTKYELNGVTTESPRCLWAFPPILRHKCAVKYPELVAKAAKVTMRGALLRTIKQYQPDVLLGHGMMPWGRLLQSVSREVGIPYSIIEHSAGDVMRLGGESPLTRYYSQVAADAERVFVVGTWMHSHLVRLGWRNVRQIPNGITEPTAVQLNRPRPHDLIDRTIVLSAANYYRRKGFEELVEAFRRVSERHPDAMLVLVTDPGEALRAQIDAAGLGDRIRCIPGMGQDALMQWMVWADLFAMPSWSEAFGLVFVEALASGTPVLMTADCGLAPQLGLALTNARSDQHGWFVEPRCADSVARALDEALLDRARLNVMGRSGRDFAMKRFTWRENAQQLLAELGGYRPQLKEAACL